MFQGKGSSCTRDAELGVGVPCNSTRLAVLSEPTSVDSRPRMSATVTLSLLAQPCECHHVPRPTSLARTHTGAGSAGGMEIVVQPLRPLPVDRPAGRRGSGGQDQCPGEQSGAEPQARQVRAVGRSPKQSEPKPPPHCCPGRRGT